MRIDAHRRACNLAWGIIDAVLYLMGSLAEKGRGLMTFRAPAQSDRSAEGPAAHRGRVAGGGRVRPAAGGTGSDAPPVETTARTSWHARLRKDDWFGALGVFLLVFVSTFPVAIPFIFMHNAGRALRLSNLIAIVLLFILGYAFGRCAGRNRWVMGISMVVLGVILVGLTMSLGG